MAELVMTEPKIGYSAHYVLDSGNNAGDCRPMVIVRGWSDNGLIQGVVFFDGTNDGRGVAEWVTSVHRNDEAKEHRTWHWPWVCPREF